MSSTDHLAPPRPTYINPDYVVPLSPPARPPFAHYHSSSSLPVTPRDHAAFPSSVSQAGSNSGPGRTGTRLRPNLTLGPRLLLSTLSPALIPLVLTICHLIANRSSTASTAASLRAQMLSACSGLAKGAATLQTLPRYLAMQTNEEMVRAAQAAIRGVGSVLMDVITVVEVVVVFVLDTYRSLLMCMIELVVRGTLELMIGAVRGITEGITTTLNAARTNIQSDIASANRFIQDAVSKLNTATSLIGVNISIPQFSIPSLSSLQDVKVSTEFQDSLVRLNATIPSLTALRQRLEDLIEKPFLLLKSEINSTRLELASSFNTSILPTPSLASLSSGQAREIERELCGNLDTSLVDDTANALRRLSDISIGLMVLLVFLIWAALCIWEWRRWRAVKDSVDILEEEWQREGRADAWRAVAIAENPVLEKYGGPVIRRLGRSERARINMRWYLAYLSHPTCLALLFIALLGFLSLQLQLLALSTIKDHARSNANATVAASTSSLSTKLNSMAANVSRQYALDYNSAIAAYQRRIDDELFGKWVNTTGVALNTTMVEFYDDIEKVLNQTFGGTVLFGPINTFMYCILGSKIDSLSSALTWLRDHAHITLPTLPPDVLLLTPEAMAEMTGPISAAAVGSSSSGGSGGEDEGIVGDLIRHFQKAIEFERNVYAILLGVWVGFALIGLAVVAWNSGGEGRYRAWRGISADDANGNDGSGGEGKGWKFWKKETQTPLYDEYAEKQFRGTAPSSPLPPAMDGGMTNPQQAGVGRSFLNYPGTTGRNTPAPTPAVAGSRPDMPRKSTFGSMASLMAPGEKFLLFGRKSPFSPEVRVRDEDDEDRLVEKGVSSEGYNRSLGHLEGRDMRRERERPRSDLETPPPFWIKKVSGLSGGVKTLFPTREQKHGEAIQAVKVNKVGRIQLDRMESDDTDPSFGHTPTAGGTPAEGEQYQYPSTSIRGYPRPMSRASTLHTGENIQVRPAVHSGAGSRPVNPFANPPDLPPMSNGKHDSIDMLIDESQYSHTDHDHDQEFGHNLSDSRVGMDRRYIEAREFSSDHHHHQHRGYVGTQNQHQRWPSRYEHYSQREREEVDTPMSEVSSLAGDADVRVEAARRGALAHAESGYLGGQVMSERRRRGEAFI